MLSFTISCGSKLCSPYFNHLTKAIFSTAMNSKFKKKAVLHLCNMYISQSAVSVLLCCPENESQIHLEGSPPGMPAEPLTLLF